MKILSSFKLIALLILCEQCFSQEIIRTLEPNVGNFKSINGLVMDDSLFFQFPDVGHAHWLRKDGSINAVHLGNLSAGKIDEIVRSGDTTDYYNFDFSRQYLEVSCISLTRHGQTEFPKQRFSGIFLGHYAQDKTIFIVYADKSNKVIKVASIRRQTVLREKQFQLTFDLLKEKNLSTAVIPEGKVPSPIEAGAPIKIFPSANKLTILKDEPFQEFNENRRRYQTILVDLDFATNESHSRFYRTPHQIYFSSTVFNNILFRFMHKDGSYVEVLDIASGKIKHSIAVPYKSQSQAYSYYRSGKKNIVQKFKELRGVRAETSFVIPHRFTDSTYLFTLGSYFEIDPHTPIGLMNGPLGIAGAIASIAVNAIVSNAVDGPIDVYKFYLSGSVNSGSEIPAQTGLASQQIDEHELTWPKERLVKGKAYFDGPTVTYSFYRLANGKVEVALFKHSEQQGSQ